MKLQLSVFTVLIQVSLAAQQQVTVMKGQTVHLSCPITAAHQNNVEWRNPENYIMFFSKNKALKDKRYTINKLSESEFSISISNVTFKDGGTYTCLQYSHPTTETKVEVTVVGYPKMSVAKHEGKSAIKCTAEGNHYPPQISWKFNDGPEFHRTAQAQVVREDKKYVSTEVLSVLPGKKRETVRCLVRHPALHSRHLMNFVKIGPKTQFPFSTTTSPPTALSTGSTEVLRTRSTTRAMVNHTPTDVRGTSSENSERLSTSEVTAPTGFPLKPVTSTHSPLSHTDDSTRLTSSSSTSRTNGTDSNATSTTGWISIANKTEEIGAEGNRTVGSDIPKMQAGAARSSSLLVLLVTCLIVCLLVVVIFITIKLRRAHIAWKRENEDSNPSEESSKSKSSQEEKSIQQQRRRGLLNTEFTKYVVDEQTATTTATTTANASPESMHQKQTPQPQMLGRTLAKCDVKETEL
ncbi:cytotoxic and regulatory T-cell molecule isoform X2 [Notolabrus celidotus]|uniref:cytotoxic and regulatory T-cell molecule isoform X2 n=1 Tax=Notolabrus celidotus TaxID=1203425 RepID=UPI00148F474C|nr:cytotoxic and regulatory T-cell molecule isoform X2 [Notolabrus celidotus]